jgi:hypothetical protein
MVRWAVVKATSSRFASRTRGASTRLAAGPGPSQPAVPTGIGSEGAGRDR